MTTVTLNPAQWAEEQFGTTRLHDARRSKRLVKVGAAVARNPSGSFPQIFESWSDLKAAYDLFGSAYVTREAIIEPHCQQTRAAATGRCLVLSDLSEIDFGRSGEIDGTFPTGNGGGNGFLLHSALMVRPAQKELIGLAGQTTHYRKPHRKDTCRVDRLKRPRETDVWGKVIDQIGRPPEGAAWIHVMDRGADNFEVLCHALQQGTGWIVRVAQKKRSILRPDGKLQPLQDYLKTLSLAGTHNQDVPARHKRRRRVARMEVRYGKLMVPPPKHQSPYLKALKPDPITTWCVWAHEVNPPRGEEGLEWILYGSEPVSSLEIARGRLGDYSTRWLIEEWHKGLKSGCRVKDRQLKTADRLESMAGLMSIEAVRLLQIKSVARTDPDRPARQVVPSVWIEMLAAVRKQHSHAAMTVYEFYRALAKLGGFLARKCDGEPGWITIWRGWEKLHLMLRGARAVGYEFKKNVRKSR